MQADNMDGESSVIDDGLPGYPGRRRKYDADRGPAGVKESKRGQVAERGVVVAQVLVYCPAQASKRAVE